MIPFTFHVTDVLVDPWTVAVPHVRHLRLGGRKPERVVNRTGQDFVVANQPGKIGNPAASAEVHIAGHRLSDVRLKIAPDPACQLDP